MWILEWKPLKLLHLYQKNSVKAMTLIYEIAMKIRVDSSANFLEVGDGNDNIKVVKEKVMDTLYDIDDIKIEELDITRRKDDTN